MRTGGAEKELPDAVLRPGLSYGHRRSASAPRRALVVLRTPMDPARVGKKPAKVTITVTGQMCCTQQLVGELGVPVATSHFSLALSREGILVSARFRSRIRMIPLLDLASLSSGTIILPALVPSDPTNRSRLLAVERLLHVESNHVLLSSWHYLLKSVGHQCRWEPPCHYVGFGFDSRICRYGSVTIKVCRLGMRHRFI